MCLTMRPPRGTHEYVVRGPDAERAVSMGPSRCDCQDCLDSEAWVVSYASVDPGQDLAAAEVKNAKLNAFDAWLFLQPFRSAN